ncbi:hypothetical protein [Occallatibacter savannae]|uniref:hypothetical protein n=1 Tax=Occallatibacter savannae TaxID=1002691 RepID=UPI000D687F1C|nr:hypothetical protein [Occallatibacter savannae]
MNRIPQFALLGAVVLSLGGRADAQSQASSAEPEVTPTTHLKSVATIPPLPKGKSTILGGSIRDIDPVLDRFTLNIVGEKPMRILYDQRTQLFVDGKRISLNQLHPAEHASVQTALDGTKVFAISVHILSQLQKGDYSGQVQSYDPTSGNLEIVGERGGDPLRLKVSSSTTFERTGQGSSTPTPAGPGDLQPGSLISLQFDPDGKGRAIATHISVLATPGSTFVFSGNLVSLDSRAGTMMVLDPRDNQTYQIGFNPGSIASIQAIRPGQHVRITAAYDGKRYLAETVTAE